MAGVTLADVTAKHNLGVVMPRTDQFILQKGLDFEKLVERDIEIAQPFLEKLHTLQELIDSNIINEIEWTLRIRNGSLFAINFLTGCLIKDANGSTRFPEIFLIDLTDWVKSQPSGKVRKIRDCWRRSKRPHYEEFVALFTEK